jgi:hypothetical protein
MDYEALAKQYGGVATTPPAVDYEALARQFGGVPMQVGTGADAIPGQRSISKAEEPVSWSDRAAGLIEIPAAAAAGALTSVAAPLAGIYGTLTSGKFGTPEGIRAGQETARKVQEWAQPQTRTAQEAFQAVAPVMEAMGAAGPNVNAMRMAPTPQATAAARAVGDARASQLNRYNTRNQLIETNKNVANSYANAPIIDAAKAAERTGLVVNPAITNPNVSNRLKNAVVGSEFDVEAAKTNAAKTTDIIRKDLGVGPTQLLDEAAVETALDKASVGYEPVRKMEALTIPEESVKSLESLRKQAPIGGEAKTAATNSLIDEALAKLQKTTSSAFSGVGGERTHVGRSGAMILDDIRSMRRDAQAIYKAQKVNPDPLAIAKADTQMSIAKILEDVVDANASSPKILSDMRKSRTRMAQIYDHDLAIDYANQTVDPQVYAKLLNERKGNMTGVGADIGKVAATFPDLMVAQSPEAQKALTYKRSGLAAAAGAVLGGAVGGYPGAIAGAGAGAAAGGLGTRILAKNMVRPEYQASRAIPVDYRPQVNNLRPADINYGPNQVVPYDFRQTATEAPNFVLRPNEYPPKATFVGPDTSVPQLGMSREPVGGQMGALRAEDTRVKEMQRAQDMQAQAQAEAAAAATRQPTKGAVELRINPLTGVPEVATGLKGATPATFQNFGSSLASAAEKVTAGKMFDMTLAEKAAWKNTRADLSEVVSGLKSLDDKAVAAKMMDRAWVEDAIGKAREKAEMFDELAQRIASDQAKRDAAIKRDQMVDLLDSLEQNLRNARPVQKGGQGPKTRAAQRNALAPETPRIILNNMAPNKE